MKLDVCVMNGKNLGGSSSTGLDEVMPRSVQPKDGPDKAAKEWI